MQKDATAIANALIVKRHCERSEAIFYLETLLLLRTPIRKITSSIPPRNDGINQNKITILQTNHSILDY